MATDFNQYNDENNSNNSSKSNNNNNNNNNYNNKNNKPVCRKFQRGECNKGPRCKCQHQHPKQQQQHDVNTEYKENNLHETVKQLQYFKDQAILNAQRQDDYEYESDS